VGPGQVPDDHVELVVSNLAAQGRPVLDEINSAFGRIFDQAHPGQGRLYVYFAGHGCALEFHHLALLMANAEMRNLNRAMNAGEYREGLARLIFPQQILWFDCCRVYDARVLGHGPDWTVPPDAPPLSGLVQVAMYASRFTEFAHEVLRNSSLRGLFTEALLDGLNGGAAVYDKTSRIWVVPISRLRPFVHDRLEELTHREGVKQSFWFEMEGSSDDLVLCSDVTPWRWPVTISVPPGTNQVVVLDHQLEQLMARELSDGATSVTFKLPPQLYTVRAEPNNLVETINVTAGPLCLDLDGGR
jgi:hypothetical protein